MSEYTEHATKARADAAWLREELQALTTHDSPLVNAVVNRLIRKVGEIEGALEVLAQELNR